jgi:hypothetical protein
MLKPLTSTLIGKLNIVAASPTTWHDSRRTQRVCGLQLKSLGGWIADCLVMNNMCSSKAVSDSGGKRALPQRIYILPIHETECS